MTAPWLDGEPMDPTATPSEPVPALPGFPIAMAEACTLIVGPTGGGRSSLIEAMIYDAAQAGLRCAYLGHEVTRDEFDARAASIAERRDDTLDDELLARLAGNARYLDLSTVMIKAWEDPEAWIEGVVASYEVVAIDPLSAVASALDFDFDKSNAEFVRFYDKLVQPLISAGVAVVLVDNIGHDEAAKKRAKGVSAKNDKPDLTFSCRPQAHPTALAVRAEKVRSVRAPHRRGDEWLFIEATQRIERREGTAPDEPVTTAFRPTNVMQKISEAVENDEGLSRRSIQTAVGANSKAVGLGLELLIAEGYIEVRKDGQAHRHHHVKPYREEDDEGTVTTVSEPSPDRFSETVLDTVSDRLPHTVGMGAGEGNGNGGGRDGQPFPTPESDVSAADLAYAERLASEGR